MTETVHWVYAVAMIGNDELGSGIAYGLFNPGSIIVVGGYNPATGTVPGPVAVNPVTGSVYVCNGAGTVWVISGRTDKVTATIHVGALPEAVAVNPVTGTVYVANASKAFQGRPEKLSLALDAYFRWEALQARLTTLAEGVRKYQNPALAAIMQ